MNSQLFITAILALIALSSGQTSCNPGSFISGNRCRFCPRGQFQALANQASCEDCPEGTIARFTGNSECTECPEFSTVNAASTRCICDDGRSGRDCELCEPGTFFERGFRRRTSCRPCQPGTFQPVAGQSECLDCPDGTSSGRRASECLTCGEDEFVSNRGECTTCPPGETLDTFRNRCVRCDMNTFKSESGLGPCVPCPPDQFSLRGAAECRECPTNSTLVSSGRCVSCPAGSSLSGRRFGRGRSACRLCPINTFMPYRNTEPRCFECTGPKFAMEGALECTRCPQNTGLLQDGTCADCPEGSVYNQRLFKCQECGVNRFTRDRMGFCDRCPTGTFARPGSSTCFSCPRGQAFIVASDECGTCPPGEEYRVSAGRCRRCFNGSIKPNEGIEQCEFCDSGISNADRTECVE